MDSGRAASDPGRRGLNEGRAATPHGAFWTARMARFTHGPYGSRRRSLPRSMNRIPQVMGFNPRRRWSVRAYSNLSIEQ